MLTNDPGFQAVSILFSDSESALIRDNVEELKERVPRLRKVVRFSPKEGKAYQVGGGLMPRAALLQSPLFVFFHCSGGEAYQSVETSYVHSFEATNPAARNE